MKSFLERYLYQMLGYAGLIPFTAFLLGYYHLQDDIILSNIMLVLQIFYASIIIGFLCGTHWVDAVREKSPLRMILSILPTILLMPIVFWGLTHSPAQALLGTVILFWFMFSVDRAYFYYRREGVTMPRGYILYRFNLTLLVTIILFSTYWIAS